MARKKSSTVGTTTDGAERTPWEMTERERFERRRSWFNMEWQRQEANRFQMALDEDYYDSLQFTEAESAIIRQRGQAPVVYNEVKPTIDWMIGTERRMRRDFKVLNRNNKNKDAADDAETKTQLLKYLSDVNRMPFVRSEASDDQLKGGLGWTYVGVNPDGEDELICFENVSWRYCLHDSMSGSRFPKDWRFFFRFGEYDLDVAQAYFPEKADLLAKASTDGLGDEPDEGWTGTFPTMGLMGHANQPARDLHYLNDMWLPNPRKRVLLIECWNFEPMRRTSKDGQMGRVQMQCFVSIMTKLDTILEAESPYRHNRIPYVPRWCYRRKRDGLPYGPIRPVRGPQDSLNKRMSKALFEASSNQLMVEKGAIDSKVMDRDEIRDEVNAPDGIVEFAAGALSGGKVQKVDRKGDAQAQLAIAELDRLMIGRGTGVTDEQRGARSNVIAAKGIIAKQENGALLTAEPFDNMLLAEQLEGELILSLIEQFYTEEKTFSVTGERFKQDWYTINGTDPMTGQKVNDVTAHKAAFVIGDAPWRQTLAEAAFESAMEMFGHLAPVAPQVVTNVLDLIFEWTDLPNKQEIVNRIRETTGMTDPDKADDPEQQQLRQKKAAIANAQFQAELAMLRAQVLEAQAKGEKLTAEAVAKRLETIYVSAQAAQLALQIPQTMIVADQLLESGGFVDKTGSGTGAVVPKLEPQPAALPSPDAQQADGMEQGIETPAADGVRAPPQGVA